MKLVKYRRLIQKRNFIAYFDLPFIPPEMREDGTEVEDYQEDLEIITLEDIKGDLHMHTTWSDGAHSIEEMAEACHGERLSIHGDYRSFSIFKSSKWSNG